MANARYKVEWEGWEGDDQFEWVTSRELPWKDFGEMIQQWYDSVAKEITETDSEYEE